MMSAEGLIVHQNEFARLCEEIRESQFVAFDTEFVSEYSYQPELCLLQFSFAERSVAVDPLEVKNLDCWWELMADDETTVVVHGGQAEIRFCLTESKTRPRKLVDVQLAEGLRSPSYPLGYGELVRRVLGNSAHGKETRTDWRKRPLTPQQIRYALDDVNHILEIWSRQRATLEQLGRLDWATSEFERMIDGMEVELARECWQRVSGTHKLNRRELAVASELSKWREREAARRNRPLRRVLRDDLIIEIARRQPKSVAELMSTRDMNRSDFKRAAGEFVRCVERGVSMPTSELPQVPKDGGSSNSRDEHVLGKLLAIALANRCSEMEVAKPLVGTSADLRSLVRWHCFDDRRGPRPRLAEGWRAEVCGDLLTDLLDGKTSLRVADPASDHPLVFESRDAD